MKRYGIIGLIGMLLAAMPLAAQDRQILSARDGIGTARYTSMAGAMAAVGGDASAVVDNPAGLGVYRSPETQISLGFYHDRTSFGGARSESRMNFIPNSASVVFCLPSRRAGAVRYNNIMIGYRRMNNCRRFHSGETDLLYYENEQSGYVNIYHVSWGMNINDRLYLGAGVNVTNPDYGKKTVKFTQGIEGYDWHNTIGLTGWGVSATAGVIWHPVRVLRLGLGIESPTAGKLTVRDYRYGEYYTPGVGYDNNRYCEESYRFEELMYLPMRLNTGIALQCLNYGLLSMEYDWTHLKGMDDVHTMKVGLEGVIRRRFFINAGYAYESTFAKPTLAAASESNAKRTDDDFRYVTGSHCVGAGVGYHGNFMQARIAYRYRLQREQIYPVAYAHLMRETEATTHAVVVTVGFRR